MGSSSRTQSISRHKSRLPNKRAEKIVEMIDGYDSVHTLSRALAVMLLVFIPLGLVMVVSGLMVAGTSAADTKNRLAAGALFAMQFEAALLWLVTLAWWIRVRSNVRRLGKSPRINFWRQVKKQLIALGLAILLLVLAIVPAIGVIALLASLALFAYAQFFWPRVQYLCMDMLWRTSSLPTGHEDVLPHFGPVWIGSLVAHQYLATAAVLYADNGATGGVLLALSGVAGIVAAFLGARLVVGVAERQEQRLDALIANSGGVVGDDQRTMSTQELGSRWNESANLVEFG